MLACVTGVAGQHPLCTAGHEGGAVDTSLFKAVLFPSPPTPLPTPSHQLSKQDPHLRRRRDTGHSKGHKNIGEEKSHGGHSVSRQQTASSSHDWVGGQSGKSGIADKGLREWGTEAATLSESKAPPEPAGHRLLSQFSPSRHQLQMTSRLGVRPWVHAPFLVLGLWLELVQVLLMVSQPPSSYAH